MGWASEAAALLAPGQRWEHPAEMAEYLTQATRRPFARPAHIELISREFAACHRRPDGRLMVHIPVRHGKTETVRWGTAWALQEDPWMRVVSGSYTLELARQSSEAVRSVAKEHGDEIGLRLRQDSRAAHRWNTPQGGGYLAVGIGGSVTGFGADLLIIDDPVKNRQAAESPAWRRRSREWWENDIYTRLEPGASIVIIATRWHRDDLPASIISTARAAGEEWRVVNLAALAVEGDELGRAPGEPLWPERYDRERLEMVRRVVGPYAWASVYQQSPQARAEGAYWTSEDLSAAQDRAPDQMPTFGELIISVDPPASSDPGADEAGILVCAREQRTGRAAVLEDLSGVMSPEAWGRVAVEAWYRWRGDRIVVEDNQGGEMVETVIRAAAREMGKPSPPVRRVNARRGKALRAEPVAQAYRHGRVWHAHAMPELDAQMTSWTPDTPDSPDRLDAMVHGLTDLLDLSADAPGVLEYDE